MLNLSIEKIKQRFPVGDIIEYQTGHGLFQGIIKGYTTDKNGAFLDLGDRRCPIWNEGDFKRTETWHKHSNSITKEPLPKPSIVQLTLF